MTAGLGQSALRGPTVATMTSGKSPQRSLGDLTVPAIGFVLL